jgi:large subunit ribosomal protein L4
MLLGALRSALSGKLRDGELKVVQSFNLENHKTKSLAAALAALNSAAKVLLVDVIAAEEQNTAERNLQLSARNLKGIKVVPTREVSVYDLLAHKHVIVSEAAAKKLSEALA